MDINTFSVPVHSHGGVAISSLSEAVHPSPGVLKNKKRGRPRGAKSKNLLAATKSVSLEIRSEEVVDIARIRAIDAIPDYLSSPMLDKPLLARITEGLFCVDGAEFIESAKASGESEIVATVIYLPNATLDDLAARKVATRLKTEAGDATSAEIIRGVVFLKALLDKSGQPLSQHTHGGARRGSEFEGKDSSQDVLTRLSQLLGKDRDTVSAYLNYSDYLTSEALNKLAEGKASKRFFEDCQARKRNMIREMASEDKSNSEIQTAVSEFMLNEYEVYEKEKDTRKRKKTVSTSPSEPAMVGQTASQEGSEQPPPESDTESDGTAGQGKTYEEYIEEFKALGGEYFSVCEIPASDRHLFLNRMSKVAKNINILLAKYSIEFNGPGRG